jgi:hypothetical protein
MDQPETMEEVVIESPTATNANGNPQSYSEWIIFVTECDSTSPMVSVNAGFQMRDFQTGERAVSVIDPDMLGKMYNEASAILNKMPSGQRKIYVLLYLCFALLSSWAWLLGLVSDDMWFFCVVVPPCYWVAVGNTPFLYFQKTAHGKLIAYAKATSLVESYQPIFLKQCGVEIGFCHPKMDFPTIYLRRSRRQVDEAVPIGGDCGAMEGHFPPIYLDRFIPGEISLVDEYHSASMKVDDETWALLLNTHVKMTHVKMTDANSSPFYLIVSKFCAKMTGANSSLYCLILSKSCEGLCWGMVLFHVLGPIVGPSACLWIIYTVSFYIPKVYDYAEDKRKLRAYGEVTKVVNQTLQKNQKSSHLAVEFHASEVPAEKGTLAEGTNLFKLDVPPTTKNRM